MVYEQDTQIQFSIETCAACGVIFGLPKRLEEKRREDHTSFYCPNGHSLVFRGKSEAEKLRDELAKQKSQREFIEAQLATALLENDHRERQLRAAKGRITKIRNRVGKGVCPCCNRSFENLQRHMHSKHPEFAQAEAATQ